MRRWLRWLVGMAAVVTLAVLAVIVVLARLDPNEYKQPLIDAVAAATGRTLSLNGPLRVSKSLWPTIQVNDVSLANIAGGSRPDMARAERIEATLSLPALLWHRLEITRLVLIGPNILFEQVGGQSNWLFQPPGGGGAPATTPGTPFQLRIRKAHVQNGMVTWRLPARTKVVGIRALDFRKPTDTGPLEVDSTLVYSDNQPFQLSARATPTGGVKAPWTTRLDFAAYDTTASATGTMDVAGDYDLQIEARAEALDKLNALLPEMALPAVTAAELSTHLTNGKRPGDLPVIGRTHLQFAGADLRDRVAGLSLGATNLDLPDAGGLAAVASTCQIGGHAFSVAGTVGVPKYPDERVTVPLQLKFQTVPGGKGAVGMLAIDGKTILNALAFAGLDTAVSASTPALAGWRTLLGDALPALTKLTVTGQFTMPADLKSLKFSNTKLVAGEGDIGGDGTVRLGLPVALDAKLHSAKLDLDAVLDAFGIQFGSAPPRSTGPVIPDVALRWPALRGPALNLSAAFGAVTFLEQAWPALQLDVQLKDGRLRVGPAQMALPGAPFAFSFTADGTAAPAPVTLSLQTPALPLAFLAQRSGLPGPVSGHARVQVKLSAAGNDTRALATSLDGSFTVSSVDGKLSNAAFKSMTSAALDALGIKVPQAGETVVRCLGLQGSVRGGVMAIPTIALETTYLSLEGAGQVDLRRENVAFQLRPLAQVAGSSVAVPVVVEGPFRAISGRLEANTFDKLGFLLNAWTGGDQSTACADAGLVTAKPPAR